MEPESAGVRLIGMIRQGMAAAVLAVALALASCANGSGARYLGTWHTVDGVAAERGEGRERTFEVRTMSMPEHCDWQDAIMLQVAWPLGSTYAIGRDEVALREYVRDAGKVLPEVPGAFRDVLDPDAELPEAAEDSGYRLDETALWFGPDGGDEYAYLVREGEVERWPRTFETIACA